MSGRMVGVNVHLSNRRKDAVARLGKALGLTPGAYARLALMLSLEEPARLSAIEKIVYGDTYRAEVCDNQFHFNIPAPYDAKLIGVCDELGVTKSSFLRAALSIPCVPAEPDGEPAFASIIEIGEARKELRSMLSEIARIGNNVNQIAWGINALKKKQWLTEREANAAFGRCGEDVDKAARSLEAMTQAVEECLRRLDGAEANFAYLKGGA